MRKLMSAVAVISLLGFSSAALAGEIHIQTDVRNTPGGGDFVETRAFVTTPAGRGPNIGIGIQIGDDTAGLKDLDVDGQNGFPDAHIFQTPSVVENVVQIGIPNK